MRKLIARNLLTEEEFQEIKACTDENYYCCHFVVFAWLNREIVKIGMKYANVEMTRSVLTIADRAQGDLDDMSIYAVPDAYQVMVYSAVIFSLGIDTITCGIRVASFLQENDGGMVLDIAYEVIALVLQILFFVSLMEFCSQVVNDCLGNDCLDANYGGHIASYIRSLQVQMKLADVAWLDEHAGKSASGSTLQSASIVQSVS